ncbi:4'-phosphopantetheinyl transferase family protein [Streptomyces sp. NPDC057702]|uniref:4'-phosphopantetheinyl transferase family protein n=1 Tax=unclassified Streptomyces TaxID=2593676 RepID=UPI0036754374
MDGHPGSAPDTVTVLWCTTNGDERRLAHTLVVRAAARRLRVPSSELWLDHEPGGRPVLGGAGAALRVSLAHARGALAVAVTDRAVVGVDVEVVRELRAEALARSWLHPAEAEWVTGLAEDARSAAFLWLWTQKESVGKARGRGLRRGGMSRRVPLAPQWPPEGDWTPRPLPGEPELAASAALVGGGRYVLGVAVDRGTGASPRVQVRRVPAAEVI